MTTQPLLLIRDALLTTDSGHVPVRDNLPPVRLLKVPDAAPPFDDETSSGAPCGVADGELEPGPDADASAPRSPDVPGQPDASQAPVLRNAFASAGTWPHQFARLLAEVLAGSRPARQLMPWLTERARFHLRRLAPAFSSGHRPRVLRVLTSQPSSGVVEMSVIIAAGARTRALALRLELDKLAGQHARWLCTDIEAA